MWFDSGSTHVFTLEDPQAFPQLAGIVRVRDGGKDRVMYLEGSDQHRGWFQSSLLESCGTRGRAPFDVVLTHGFILDEKGEEKMSKSRGNTLSPQELMKTSGADILRLWVSSSDYSSDIRFGPAILQGTAEAYRKLRNTLRWMLGMLAHHEGKAKVTPKAMPELERLMLHRLAELDVVIREAYAAYDYKRVVAALSQFMNTDLSAFYVDIRKDALYCEPYSSKKRLAALETIEQIFRCTTLWLAPLMCFTAEEAWLARYPSEEGSVHLELFPAIPKAWRDEALARSGRRSSACAASSPARWRSSVRPSASARRWRRRPRSISPIPICWRRSTASTWPRCASPRASTSSRARPPPAPSRWRTFRASPSCPSRRKARSARAPGASPRTSAAIRPSPTCPPATPPPCASSTSAPRRGPDRVFGGSGSLGPEPRSARMCRPELPPPRYAATLPQHRSTPGRRAVEFMVGVYDLYAFAAIHRRWMFWLLAASIPMGLLVAAIEIAHHLAA